MNGIILTTLSFNVASAGFFGPGSGSGSGSGDDWTWPFGPDNSNYVQDSLDYARSQADLNWHAMRNNIRHQFHGSAPTIDLLWPGNGFDQAQYAGNYAVLKYLESHGVLKVGRVMGGSGGATAALLALASEETGVDAARLMTESFGDQADDPGFYALEKEYLARISDGWGELKGTITEDLYVAVVADLSSYTKTVVYNLQNPTQAAQAVLGSGGTHYTIDIPGVECIGATFDGGIMSAFETNQRPTIYVAAWNGGAMGCDRSCIKANFMKGVENTIAMLRSKSLVAPISSWGCGFSDCNGMVLSKSGKGSDLASLSNQHLGGGHFGRYEPVPASTNTWVNAATRCSGNGSGWNWWGRRRSAKGPQRLLDLMEPQEAETAGL